MRRFRRRFRRGRRRFARRYRKAHRGHRHANIRYLPTLFPDRLRVKLNYAETFWSGVIAMGTNTWSTWWYGNSPKFSSPNINPTIITTGLLTYLTSTNSVDAPYKECVVAASKFVIQCVGTNAGTSADDRTASTWTIIASRESFTSSSTADTLAILPNSRSLLLPPTVTTRCPFMKNYMTTAKVLTQPIMTCKEQSLASTYGTTSTPTTAPASIISPTIPWYHYLYVTTLGAATAAWSVTGRIKITFYCEFANRNVKLADEDIAP